MVLVAYGSRGVEARSTYQRIVAAYEEEFLGAEVSLAFSSGRMRKGSGGETIPGPLKALAEIQEMGYGEAVVQSLQVVPGFEFHHVAALVRALEVPGNRLCFDRLSLGAPLLTAAEDYDEVSKALAPQLDRPVAEEVGQGKAAWDNPGEPVPGREAVPEMRDPERVAVVLMGHGTGHPADAAYTRMAGILERDHENVFLGTMDGWPGLGEVVGKVRSSGVDEVWLMPFLVVAGGHAISDMAGGPGSWRAALEREGWRVRPCLRGLADNGVLLRIFMEHTHKALKDLG